MATKIEMNQTFAADAATIRALQADPDYIVFRGQRTGAASVTADVEQASDGSTSITIVRTLPTDGMPSFAKAFVGEAITVTEHYAWQAPAADGGATGSLTATFSAPISCSAELQMRPEGSETVIVTSGTITSSVAFIGGKVEDLAKQQMLRYLTKEQALATEWLSGAR